MKKFGIGKKMMIGGVILVLAPLLVVGTFAAYQASASLQQTAEQRAELTAQKLAEMAETVLKEELKIATGLASYDMVAEAVVNQDEAGLKAVSNILTSTGNAVGENYEAIIAVNREGLVVSDSVQGKTIGINVLDRDYFQKAMKGEGNVGNVAVSKSSGTPIAVVAAPIKDDSNKVVGMIGLVLKVEFLINKIVTTQIGKTGYPFVVDHDGLIVVHPRPELILKTNLRDDTGGQMAEIMSAMLAGKTGYNNYVFEGIPKIAGYAPIPITGWSLAVTQNRDEFMAPVVTIRNGTILVGVVFLGLAIIALIFFARSISKPLVRATNIAGDIAKGDLTQRMDYTSRDEVGSLSEALDTMVEGLERKAELAERIASGDLTAEVVIASERDVLGNALHKMVVSLNEVLGEVNSSAGQVRIGTGQVSDSSQSLSQGATEQAASIQEITSSMTELASQTKNNADNATQANQLAMSASSAAGTGNSRMQEMIQAMSEIETSSKEIAKIIKAIDDIAFQTNLLALNAAVEAARAGKHGKGFAVVAQEVRSLAGRSAKAAQETAELIEASVKNVANGAEIVHKTAEALGEIVTGATRVADLVGEIAAASNEQAQGITQINQGLSQIEQVTQQNTASAEETASAAEELSSQAMEMSGLVARFKLKERRRSASTTTSMRSAPALPSESAWGAMESSIKDERVVRPETIIALDDSEFGKY